MAQHEHGNGLSTVKKPSKLKAVRKFIRKNPVGVLGMILVFISVFTAIFATWISPQDPTESVLTDRLTPPS